jgi:hypothetical protein
MTQLEGTPIQIVFEATAENLVRSLQHNEVGDISGVTLPDGWTEINPPRDDLYRNINKVKAANSKTGLFAKVFNPNLQRFAIAAYQGLGELARLPLNHPILAPEGYAEGVIFFPLGTPVKKMRYGECFSEREQLEIEKILGRRALTSLGWFEKVDIVSVKGQEFVADPFDDSESFISSFRDG